MKTTNKNSLSYMTLQAQTLNLSARKHESLGNSVLANWMRESAEYFENRCHEINDILDSMSLGNYAQSRRSEREQYADAWYAYEEEYAYNFCGEN